MARSLSSILSGSTPQTSEARLQTMLRELLSGAAKSGELDPEAFWAFVAALAQGRGIADRLRQAGELAADNVVANQKSPASTLEYRQWRARNLRILTHLLSELHFWTPPESLLPTEFNAGVIGEDLLSMLAGPGGMGDSEPIILTHNKKGQQRQRRAARCAIVGVVLWRAARTKSTLASVYRSLGVTDENWTKWLKKAGTARGEYGRSARIAGEKGLVHHIWSAPDEKLRPVLALAIGKKKKTKKKTVRK